MRFARNHQAEIGAITIASLPSKQVTKESQKGSVLSLLLDN